MFLNQLITLSLYSLFVTLYQNYLSMKRKNARFELEQERFDDLMRVFHECLAHTRHINTNQLLAMAIELPSSRFWVSEERATIVVSDMLKGKSIQHMNNNKRRMYEEIHKRVLSILKHSPNLPISRVVADVIQQQAPCFYMNIDNARRIYFPQKKQWYQKRLKRFKYLAGVI